MPKILRIRKEKKYGVYVWINTETDELRREQCLCLNCDHLTQCVIAKNSHELCKKHDIAFMMTRCPKWEEIPNGS